MTHQPLDPDYEQRVRTSFASQPFMETLGATLDLVEPGVVVISLKPTTDLHQQHGFVHGGAVAAILDSACGYAAFSLMEAGAGVLTVEYKVNLTAPASGDRVEARGEVIRPGRTITVCNGEAVAYVDGKQHTVAMMQATMMQITGRPDIVG